MDGKGKGNEIYPIYWEHSKCNGKVDDVTLNFKTITMLFYARNTRF